MISCFIDKHKNTMSLRKKISNTVKKQQFRPGWLGVLVNPFYFTRHEIHRHISRLAPSLKGKILDIGCGEKPYRALFQNVTDYIGMEFDTLDNRNRSAADIFYTGGEFPFPDNSFESAIATEVLEHIFNPDQFLGEINRVLKPGGKLLLTCPFVWDEHSQPLDYARYSSFGLTHLIQKHGFKIIQFTKTATDIRVLFQLASGYVYKTIPFKKYLVRLCFYLVLTFPITVLGIFLSLVLPKNPNLYLNNIVLAEK